MSFSAGSFWINQVCETILLDGVGTVCIVVRSVQVCLVVDARVRDHLRYVFWLDLEQVFLRYSWTAKSVWPVHGVGHGNVDPSIISKSFRFTKLAITEPLCFRLLLVMSMVCAWVDRLCFGFGSNAKT